jgi:outer membrane protein OmpA-like peptidoglycan-associated protein
MSRTALVVASLVGLLHAACGAGTPRPDDRADRDHDTVTDANDLCPLVPEDLDGLDDADGCPESEAADADHDGQPDHGDMCPCVAEDRDEFQDEDGCPDPDNDSDRIVDACDRCPNEPETYQGSCDDDGCPDASHVCVEEPITIPARLQFDARSSRARPEHGELLDRIAQTLIENPQVQRLIVRGHATSRERDPSALALARAETVRMELVRRGVQRERLEVEGVPEIGRAHV